MDMERPILFSTPMVKAILAGKKTMTRRVIKPKTLDKFINLIWNPNENLNLSPWKVGDVLWVRETWNGIRLGNGPEYWYRADEPEDADTGVLRERWRPSIFMPRAAARLFLKVTSIRVERLQEITEEDAIAEGVLWNRARKINELEKSNNIIDNAKALFMRLWDAINAKRGYGWDVNPYVWVISFEVLDSTK